ncbi:MAG TPA: FAD-dependent oxidoreductase, partial [Acidimicrobiales bacterium]|nr:FAD-dependent oxidoreductase [Acidimicrobiales bacterium]
MARYDLVIVGMGSGGMVGAEFAATIGLRVAVVERARVGGDCLWTGCVPSKALLASAKAAHTMRVADKYGLPSVAPEIDTSLVWKRIRAIQQEVASTDDNPQRFREMGVEVVFGSARLTGPNTVLVTPAGGEADRELEARIILLCTGSRPAVPPVEGLREAGFLTSENVFEIERAPRSVVMIGGGPIAIEMAQAFTRLGVRTTVLQKGPGVLPRDEPDLVALLTRRLRDEGVDLRVNVDTERVSVSEGQKLVHGSENGEPARWQAEELFVAAGRRPNIEGLGLDEMGVKVGKRGVEVDERMRTSVPSVYATGDVAGRYLFTHSAGYEAVRAIRDAFYPGKGKVTDLVPWCTFTDPELAHAGVTITEAEARYGDDVEVFRIELTHSDRARADSTTEGAILLVT